MNYILVYHKDRPTSQWIYVPSTNRGCFVNDSLEDAYRNIPYCVHSSAYHDIESYTRYVEQLNHYPVNTLHYEQQPDLPYEFW